MRDMAGSDLRITITAPFPAEPLHDCDLHIWDVLPAADVAQTLELVGRIGHHTEHVFLVDRDQAPPLLQELNGAFSSILLRPLNSLHLRSLLTSRVNHHARNKSSERDQMLQTVLEMNLRLQEHEQDRSRFIYKILNDLREPLIGFEGYCDLLLDRKLGPLTDQQTHAVRSLQESIKRLFRVSAAIQELSGSDRTFASPQILPADIELCVQRAVSEVQTLATRRKVQIRVELADVPERFWFDQLQIEELMVHLLDNACRSSRTGSEVVVEGRPVFMDRRAANVSATISRDCRRTLESRAHNAYRIEVRDLGSGLSQGELDRLFEDFVSAGGMQNGSRLNGLRLATCKQTVNRHGGRMFAEANEDGSRFIVELPLEHQHARGVSRASEAVGRTVADMAADQA